MLQTSIENPGKDWNKRDIHKKQIWIEKMMVGMMIEREVKFEWVNYCYSGDRAKFEKGTPPLPDPPPPSGEKHDFTANTGMKLSQSLEQK